MSATIRVAIASDAEAAKKIREALPLHLSRAYEHNIGRPNCVNLVAEGDSGVVGFITVLVGPGNQFGKAVWERLQPYVGFVGVLEQHRHNGVCRDLVEAAVQHLQRHDAGIDRLYLECEQPLIALYKKMGFALLETGKVRALCGLVPRGFVMRRIA